MLHLAFCLYGLHSTVRSACFIKYIGYWGGLPGAEEPVPVQTPKSKLQIFSEIFFQTDGSYMIYKYECMIHILIRSVLNKIQGE